MKYLFMLFVAATALIGTASAISSSDDCCNGGACCLAHLGCCGK